MCSNAAVTCVLLYATTKNLKKADQHYKSWITLRGYFWKFSIVNFKTISITVSLQNEISHSLVFFQDGSICNEMNGSE